MIPTEIVGRYAGFAWEVRFIQARLIHVVTRWVWFLAHGFPDESEWEISQGCADVQVQGKNILVRLFKKREAYFSESGAIVNQNTLDDMGGEYPGMDQLAEISGVVPNNWKVKLEYSRWGTDEYGLMLEGNYFSHMHPDGGYEALTLDATGVMVIGLRHDLSKHDKALFQRKLPRKRH